MKKNIHPQYFLAAKAICGCGNKFTVGASVPEIKVEICSKCHPFYTGSQELIDTTGRVERFKARRAKALGSRALGSRNRKKKSKSKA